MRLSPPLLLLLLLGGTWTRADENDKARSVGDVNGDGAIDASDAFAVAGHVAGLFLLNATEQHAADVVPDKILDQADVQSLFRATLKPVVFPPFEPFSPDLPAIVELNPSSGLPGTRFTIRGPGIPGSARIVHFGSRMAEIVATGPGMVEAVVPPDATSGLVRVETPVGVSLGIGFVVAGALPPPSPIPLPGEVWLTLPSGVLEIGSAVIAPILFHSGEAEFGVLSLNARYDATRLRAQEVLPTGTQLRLATFDDCSGIENTIGTLGIILHSETRPLRGSARGLIPAANVVFSVVAPYTSPLAFLQGVLRVFQDASWPGEPIGTPLPRFLDTCRSNEPPIPAPPPVLPTLEAIVPPAALIGAEVRLLGRDLAIGPLSPLVFLGGRLAFGTAVGPDEVRVRVPTGATSGVASVTSAGQVSNALPFTVLPDATAPRIVRTWPSPGGRLAPGATLEVEFSEVMDVASLNLGVSVTMTDYYGIWREPGSPTVRVPCAAIASRVRATTLVLQPVFPLPAGASGQLVVTGEVLDLNGNPLANPLVLPFTVEE